MKLPVKIITLSYPHPYETSDFERMVLALGYFDGLHKGHQMVINKAKEIAAEKGLKSAVMTFDPHPSVILKKADQQAAAIITLDEKIRLLEEMDIDVLIIVKFTEQFAALRPQEFVDEFIIGLNVEHVVAGFDFTYGHMGKGTMETLPFHSRNEFLQTTVEKQTDHDRKISSTLIREVLRSGDVSYAMCLLGRPHYVKGTVIHGDKRGRTIGFPTANVDVDESYIVPPTGVYAVKIAIDGTEYEAVCNIGYKPTFKEERAVKPSVEVHIFQFNSEIYGKEVIISWYKRIRSEQKFHNVEELISQIGKDKDAAEQYFIENNK